jgi:hypothetical protein
LIPDALGDLLDGFVLTVLIAVALGTIYYAIRLVKELRRFHQEMKSASCRPDVGHDPHGHALAYVYFGEEPGRAVGAATISQCL